MLLQNVPVVTGEGRLLTIIVVGINRKRKKNWSFIK